MREEEWRPVVGYEGLYEVSDLGRVRRMATRVNHGRGSMRECVGRTLRHGKTHGNYHQAYLSKHGVAKKWYVHRLVASAFLGLMPHQFVNHISGNKDDNSLSNLAPCTRGENAIHSTRVLGNSRGERCHLARLSEAQALAALAFTALGFTYADTARTFGTDGQTISDIANGRTWGFLTGYPREPRRRTSAYLSASPCSRSVG